MKKFISLIIVIVSLALVASCTPYHAQGAGIGGVVGGVEVPDAAQRVEHIETKVAAIFDVRVK